MQNVETRKFIKDLNGYDYKADRSSGSSHTVFERVVVIKHTVSIPTNAKNLNGPMADRIMKSVVAFDKCISDAIAMNKY